MERIIILRSYYSDVVTLLAIIGLSNGLFQNDILAFKPKSAEPKSNPDRETCQEFPELNKRQGYMCDKYPEATASAMQGVLLAMDECQRQFEGHRWNCSNLDPSIISDHPFVNHGFREAAFTHAITSAAVLHQVAVSCLMGKISSCRCYRDSSTQPNDEFFWRGCSHDLSYGAKFARRFLLQKRKGGQTIQSMIRAHNSKIGRKAILKQKTTKCKCHGTSASCEIKSCWLAAPDLKDVGAGLKGLYNDATMVGRTNSVKGKIVPIGEFDENYAEQKNGRTSKLNKQLVYHETSPTYCNAIKELHLYGTSGRVCSKTSNSTSSCGSLCCGRGFHTVRVRKIEKCNKKFNSSTYNVVFQMCKFDEWVTLCK